MFFKKLWYYNKALFSFVTVFIIAMIIIMYKWGIVATPVLQFGMYSSKFYTSDTQTVYQVFANGKKIDITQYNMAARDMIQNPLIFYTNQKRINSEAYVTIKNLFNKTGIGGWVKESNYTNDISDSSFTQWYIAKLSSIIKYPVNTIDVFKQQYIYQNDHLELVTAPQKLPAIVTYK